MFLISITQNPIQVKLDNKEYKINYFKIEPLFATIVTDNLLSQYMAETNGFSIIESPFVNRQNVRDIILSEVVYNRRENKLSISANTYSARPIYYHLNSAGEFYCSTHISMLKKAGVLIEENIDVLPEFFMYQFITPPKTHYKNINRLSFGSKLYIGLANGKFIAEQEQKYDLFSIKSSICPGSDSTEKIVEKTYTDILRSVNRLSSCRDRIAVLLSGGLDSSILFNICKKIFNINKSYSTSYPFENDSDDREKKYALSAAEAFGSEHYFYESDNKEFLFGFLKAILTAEEPTSETRHTMLYLLYKNGIPKNNNIVIDGEGADMIFGNPNHFSVYNLNKHKAMYKLLSLHPLFSLVKATSKITKRGYSLIRRLNKLNDIYRPLEDPDSILYSTGIGREDWVSKYFNVSKKDIILNKYELLKPFNNNSIYDILSILAFIYGGTIINSGRSKIAEANGKIIYYPFLDNILMNNAFSINWEDKLKQPKNILRIIARDLNIPKFIIERKKSNFGVRSRKWSGKGGILDPLIALAAKCFDKNMIIDIQSNQKNNAEIFFSILRYSIWKRMFIDNEPLETLEEELSRSIAGNS